MKKKICACDVLVIHDVRNYRGAAFDSFENRIIINGTAKKIKLKIFTTFIFTISCDFIG